MDNHWQSELSAEYEKEQRLKDLALCDKLFVYGTLKSHEYRGVRFLHPILEGVEFLGEDTTKGAFTMCYYGPPMLLPEPYYNVDSSTDEISPRLPVKGEVYKLGETNDSTLLKLDIMEHHPDWYERRLITTKTFGLVWCYLIHENTEETVCGIVDGCYEY